MLDKILLAIIKFYQKAISPLLPARCRYYPTCSAYGRWAIRWHGVGRGLPLLIARIGSCHPWGGSGADFVPVPMYRYQFDFIDKNNVSSFGLGVFLDVCSYRARLNHLMKTT